MSNKPESILRSSIRSFLSAFCRGIGYLVVLIPIIVMIGAFASFKETAPHKTYDKVVMPDAYGKRGMFSLTKPKILQININGLIGSDKLSAKTVKTMLQESREGQFETSPVKGILLMINTPGGTVFDADGIYHALKEYKQKYRVPIYAYVDGLCASGGMYVASAADKIYSNDTSIIGSVGVIIPTFMNFKDALEKIGVQTMTISAGKGKDALNPLRTWNKNEASNYELLVNHFYNQFVDIVSENRTQLSKDKLVNDYGARIFPANLAKEYGYIDETGSSRDTALTDLAETAGVSKNYQVVRMEKENWFENLFNVQSPLFTGKIKHQFNLGFDLPPEFNNKFLYLYQPGL